MTGTSYNAKDVICPFYKNDDKNHVSCEGVYPDTIIIHWFRCKKDKDIAFRAYCCTGAWKKCLLAKIIRSEYE